MYANPADYFMKITTFRKDKNQEDVERLETILYSYHSRIAPNVENESQKLRLLNPDLSMERANASFTEQLI